MKESNPKNIISFSSSTESIFFQSNLLQLSIIGGTQIVTDDISMQRQIKTNFINKRLFLCFLIESLSVPAYAGLGWRLKVKFADIKHCREWWSVLQKYLKPKCLSTPLHALFFSSCSGIHFQNKPILNHLNMI